ncbi:type VI secretion system tube protein Hcp [Aquisalimonas lutea]|uniref:Hcp family type VI secretion system effector n=1 Tax=Aquisalimonas lutea TaxID=1327750 RepID=UPI0025B48327|nr:type VI secretion system tube protein Hcp [Aquisalimonas lutea]MDN3517521.1 type VI secretion system tube protein Hcp [Aquisalimonas lutea]
MSIFMSFPGIQGETADMSHVGFLNIDYLEWSVARRITSPPGTSFDRESANAEITDLFLIRRMDSATPRLFLEACCGSGKEILIRLTKTGVGSGAETFAEYVLKNAIISDYEVTATKNDAIRPVEELTISFTGLELRYTPYDDRGKALASASVGFDTSTNQKL